MAPERVRHPTSRLDPAIHQPVRLGILSVLGESTRVDFVSLRDLLGLSDGNLSSHLPTLEAAGYVDIEKVFEKRKPRTWITVTHAGRAALATEIAALREIVAAADAAPGAATSPSGADPLPAS